MANNTLFDGDAYWNDSWVQELDGDEERLYHFYITSPNLDKSGVYKQTERSVEFYVRGIGIEKIREITAKFAKAKKVIRCGEWIIVPSSLKHQNYRNLPKVVNSITEYLKKLPEEVFEALRDCDYPIDLDKIRSKRHHEAECLPIDMSKEAECLPIDIAQNSENTECLSETLPEFNSIKFNSIQSELNITELNPTQSNADAKKLSSHFIQRWQAAANVFNCLARLKRPTDWQAFWEQNTMTLEQIDLAIDNFIEGVKTGAIERRFIPSSPDGFVLNGWITRSLSQFKKQGQRIGNDSAAEDLNKYFREA
jgi:hypothetical protein